MLHMLSLNKCILSHKIPDILITKCKSKFYKQLLECWSVLKNINPIGDNEIIIFGYLLKDQNRTPLNALILVTKKYIYDSALSNSALNFQILKHRLEEVFTNESLLSKLNNTENTFNKKWGNLKAFFG